MAWEDRDYYRVRRGGGIGGGSGFGGGGFGNALRGHSVVTWLIVINVVVFILDSILSGGSRTAPYISPFYWGNFNVDQAVYHFQVWRWLTYQFLHGGFFHILFNMIVLYFFGPMMERWWGSRRFVAFYLLCGISGAVLFTIMALVTPGLAVLGPRPTLVPLIGASGSIFGILVGAAVCFPRERVMLIFPPIPMTMRTMAWLALGLAALTLLAGGRDAAAQGCHLGGALLGWILVKSPRSLDWADGLSGVRLEGITQRLKQRRTQWQQKSQATSEAEVDRILDKVKHHGLQSLTRREKKTLTQATKRQQRTG